MKALGGSYTVEVSVIMGGVLLSLAFIIGYQQRRSAIYTEIFRLHQQIEQITHQPPGALDQTIKMDGEKIIGHTGNGATIERKLVRPERWMRMIEQIR